MIYKSGDLERLIKAMSGQEKRYFTLFSGTFSTAEQEPLYLRLFHAISKPGSEPPDFEKEISKQAYTTAKRRLFQNILKCLSVYHAEKSTDIIIQDLLGETEILYGLNLPSQSLFPLTRAYALATEHEKFGLLLQVLEWERRINLVLDLPTRSPAAIRLEEKAIHAKLSQLLELEHIYSRAKELKKQHGYIKGGQKRNLQRETIEAKGMPLLTECLSKRAVYYYHFIHALYSWMTFDHRSAFAHSKELLQPEIQVVFPNDYIDGILEHVTSCVCLGMFDAALNGLNITQEYLKGQQLSLSPSYRLKLFYYQACYQVIIFNYTGKAKELKLTVEDTEQQLTLLDDQLPMEFRQVILANLMNAYLGLGNLKRVNEIWDNLFRKQSKSIRRDIYDDLYLFRLFYVLQDGEYESLPSLAASAGRYYRKFKDNQTHFRLELAIVSLLVKEYDLSRKQIRMELLSKVKITLDKYMASLKGSAQFQEHYTLYVIWVESLLNEIPFHKAAAKWYKSFKV